jgi:hypothetical protein
MSAPEEQRPSPPGARLADSEEQRRKFTRAPLRGMFPFGRGAVNGADPEGPQQSKARRLGRGAFVLFLVLAALLALGMVWLWLAHSATPEGLFWHDHLPHF